MKAKHTPGPWRMKPENDYHMYIGYLAGWASALLVWLLFIQGTGGW